MVDDPEMPKDMRQRFLRKVHDQSDRLTNIVMDLLTLSRADATHTEENSDPISIPNLIRMVFNNGNPTLSAKRSLWNRSSVMNRF